MSRPLLAVERMSLYHSLGLASLFRLGRTSLIWVFVFCFFKYLLWSKLYLSVLFITQKDFLNVLK